MTATQAPARYWAVSRRDGQHHRFRTPASASLCGAARLYGDQQVTNDPPINARVCAECNRRHHEEIN
jgi:hypothetical protein